LFFLALALLLRLFGRHGTARSQCQHAHHQRREGAPPQHGFWSHLHIPLALSAPQCTGPGRDPTRPATHSAARFAPPELPRIPLHVNHKSAAVATARRGAAARELGAWGAAPRYFGFGGARTSLLPSRCLLPRNEKMAASMQSGSSDDVAGTAKRQPRQSEIRLFRRRPNILLPLETGRCRHWIHFVAAVGCEAATDALF